MIIFRAFFTSVLFPWENLPPGYAKAVSPLAALKCKLDHSNEFPVFFKDSTHDKSFLLRDKYMCLQTYSLFLISFFGENSGPSEIDRIKHLGEMTAHHRIN